MIGFTVMGKAFRILSLCIVLLSITGCKPDEPPPKPIWEDVKITDIAPGGSGQTLRPLKTADFELYIFEAPIENFSYVSKIWPTLDARPLRFRNFAVFGANSFAAGTARAGNLDDITHLLSQAGGRQMLTTALLLPSGLAQVIQINGLDRKRDIYYASPSSNTDSQTIGPGIFGLRITAARPLGVNGVADVMVYPVCGNPGTGVIDSQIRKEPEVRFMDLAFRVRMSPGDMLVVGPREQVQDQRTLGGLTFGNPAGTVFLLEGERPQPLPSVRLMVLICRRVNY